jgi:hypothetical protein
MEASGWEGADSAKKNFHLLFAMPTIPHSRCVGCEMQLLEMPPEMIRSSTSPQTLFYLEFPPQPLCATSSGLEYVSEIRTGV